MFDVIHVRKCFPVHYWQPKLETQQINVGEDSITMNAWDKENKKINLGGLAAKNPLLEELSNLKREKSYGSQSKKGVICGDDIT